MKCSEAIDHLQNILMNCGDLEIIGAELADDTPLGSFVVLNKADETAASSSTDKKPHSVFMSI